MDLDPDIFNPFSSHFKNQKILNFNLLVARFAREMCVAKHTGICFGLVLQICNLCRILIHNFNVSESCKNSFRYIEICYYHSH